MKIHNKQIQTYVQCQDMGEEFSSNLVLFIDTFCRVYYIFSTLSFRIILHMGYVYGLN